MQRYLSLWLYWLLVLVTLSSAVGHSVLGSLSVWSTHHVSPTIGVTRSEGHDGLFTKPSSTTQEYLLKEKQLNKQTHPFARIESIVDLEQHDQKNWGRRWQQAPPLSFLFFFPRKIAPPSATDDPFLS